MLVMYNHVIQEEIDQIHIQAKMWGAEIKDDIDAPETKTFKKGESAFQFKAPEEYDNLSKQEKKELTEKMMGQHKQWAGENEILKEKRPRWQGES